MEDKVFNGKIKDGFAEYKLEVTEAHEDPLYQIVKRKRKHIHGKGYKTVGKRREVTQLLTESEAEAAVALLKDHFEDEE